MSQNIYSIQDGSMEYECIESDRPEEISDNSISIGGGMVIIPSEDGSMEFELVELERAEEFADHSISFEDDVVIINYETHSIVTAPIAGIWTLPPDGSTAPESIKEDKTASIVEDLNQERNKRIFRILRLLNEASSEFFEEELINLKERDRLGKIERFDKSKKEARKFMEALPLDLNLPSVIHEPDGEIGLEWRFNKRGFLITFEGDNIISYAGFFGENDRVYGTKDFIENCEIPKNLIEYIYEVFSTNS